ncbi:MAG: SHOCT domain-containing protein [Pyrinomonadaceae bacterium]
MFALIFIGFFSLALVIIWLAFRKAGRDSSTWQQPRIQMSSMPNLISSAVVKTRIIFNGQEYSSIDQMPEQIRRAYEVAIGAAFTDANKNGIPDFLESGANTISVQKPVNTFEDPNVSLTKLKELKDSGLITEQEFEDKKKEILNRM